MIPGFPETYGQGERQSSALRWFRAACRQSEQAVPVILKRM
jgi:hypothetical protein